MHHAGIEFHNFAELNDCDGSPSPQRVPERVRLQLEAGAQEQTLDPGSGEIRFVLEPGHKVTITLSSMECSQVASFFGDLGPGDATHTPEKVAAFRRILREVVADCPTPNVSLFEGTDLLPHFSGLTTDLIHPADDGMIEMGANLAAALRGLLAKPVPDSSGELALPRVGA